MHEPARLDLLERLHRAVLRYRQTLQAGMECLRAQGGHGGFVGHADQSTAAWQEVIDVLKALEGEY